MKKLMDIRQKDPNCNIEKIEGKNVFKKNIQRPKSHIVNNKGTNSTIKSKKKYLSMAYPLIIICQITGIVYDTPLESWSLHPP